MRCAVPAEPEAFRRALSAMRFALPSLASWPRHFLVATVRGYRLLLSPWLGSSCRFEPTCSAYAIEALETHGAAAGSYLTLHRLARCNPLCAAGHDPVPARAGRLFREGVASASRRAATLTTSSTDKTSS